MIKLNDVEYEHRPGLTLEELMGEYNSTHQKKLAFDTSVVVVDHKAVPAAQARSMVLAGSESIFIVPIMDGG